MNKQFYCLPHRKARVSGALDSIVTLVTLGAVGVGGYFLYKLISSGGGLNSGTNSNNTGIQTNSAATAQTDLAASQAKGIAQSLADSQLNGYATQLYQLIGNGGGPPVDDNTAIQIDQIVTQVQNSTDWFRLVQLFGTKQYNSGGSFTTCALLGMGCDSYDLPSLLGLSLPAANKASVNSYFSDQGINVTI